MLRRPPFNVQAIRMREKMACGRREMIIISRLSVEGKSVWIDAGNIHATGSDPSSLGMMQPEGRPQQGKLKT